MKINKKGNSLFKEKNLKIKKRITSFYQTQQMSLKMC